MARCGRLVLIATMGGGSAELDLRALLAKRLRLVGSTLRARALAEKVDLTAAFVRDVLPGFADGRFRPLVDSVFPLERVGRRAPADGGERERRQDRPDGGRVTYRAAVFDLDGTLLDSYVGIHDSLATVLEHFDRPPVTVEEARRLVGHGLEALIAKVLPEELREERPGDSGSGTRSTRRSSRG